MHAGIVVGASTACVHTCILRGHVVCVRVCACACACVCIYARVFARRACVCRAARVCSAMRTWGRTFVCVRVSMYMYDCGPRGIRDGPGGGGEVYDCVQLNASVYQYGIMPFCSRLWLPPGNLRLFTYSLVLWIYLSSFDVFLLRLGYPF